ncbi:unnamed protein product, partial [Mesorhabditis spiculigera]
MTFSRYFWRLGDRIGNIKTATKLSADAIKLATTFARLDEFHALQKTNDAIKAVQAFTAAVPADPAGEKEPKVTPVLDEHQWETAKVKIAEKRKLFVQSVFPQGIRDAKDAKDLAQRLLPGERKLIYDVLRKITIDQYLDEKRDGNAEVHADDIVKIWYIYYIPVTIFGFLDNAILITVGEEIDEHFGVVLGISILAAAGVSNILVNLLGIGLPRIIERWAEAFGLVRPVLSAEQWNNRHVRVVVTLARICGVLTGCTLGLLPLFFLNTAHRQPVVEGSQYADSEADEDEFIVVGDSAPEQADPNDEDAVKIDVPAAQTRPTVPMECSPSP